MLKSLSETHGDLGVARELVDVQRYVEGRGQPLAAVLPVLLEGFAEVVADDDPLPHGRHCE